MEMLIGFEFKKIRHTFLQALIVASLAGPAAMIAVIYASGNKTFFETVTGNSVFVQMLPFAVTVIFACYIVTREFKDNTILYLKITPQSPVRIMLSKMLLTVAELGFSQIVSFVLLFIINTGMDGFDAKLPVKYLEAGLISAGAFGCLVPLMIFISLLRRSFSGSALVFLVIFMLTFPFAFTENGQVFPHLLPMILVARFFGNSIYDNTGIWSSVFILVATAVIFLYLSVRITEKKE